MPMQAKGEFTMQTWDEQPYEEFEGGGKLTRAHVTNAFRGDIEGRSTLESLLAYRDDDYACFVGIERVTGRVGERSGSFVLQHRGTWDDGVVTAAWFVVMGKATGELSGLRGEGGYLWDGSHDRHTTPFTLEYDVE
ncbi:MAG: DUF3224 domain-containing protein [Thermomicrobiales bacterium]